MTIKKKLFFTGLGIFIGCLVFSTITVMNLRKIQNNFVQFKEFSMAGKIALLEINRDVNYVSRLTRNIMLGSNIDKDIKKLHSRIERITQAYVQLEHTAVTQEERSLIQQAKQASLAFVQDGLRHVTSLKKIPVDQRHLSYKDYGKTATPLAVQSRKIFPQLIKEKDTQTVQGIQLLRESIQQQLILLYISIPVLLSFVIIVFFGLTKVIGNPLKKLTEMADSIGHGDLSIRLKLKSHDELHHLADMMNKMADALSQKALLAEAIAQGDLNSEIHILSQQDRLGIAYQGMYASLNESLHMVNNASNQIGNKAVSVAEESQSLLHGATESAASLEQISSSLTQMSSQTKHNADNANQVNTLSSEAKNAAEIGNKKMQQMVIAMAEIHDAGQHINKIIKVIDEIAFQTNLLALNAAVEAARAGQHGKGFAVVAEEVRNLAARSAKAASETAELITGSTQKTDNGAEIANDTAKSLEDIFIGVSKVSDLAEEIATASNEQADGINQINSGLSQIDSIIQQNASTAQKSTNEAAEVSAFASELQEMLRRFKLSNKNQSIASNSIMIDQTSHRD